MSTTPYSLGWGHGWSRLAPNPPSGCEEQYRRGYEAGGRERSRQQGVVVSAADEGETRQ